MQNVQFVKGIILGQREQVKWGNNFPLAKKINWGMLISHHPPCQYDRTFCFFHVRFCARCTGIIVGIACSIIFIQTCHIEFKWILISAILLPFPAIINFTFCELGKFKNNNYMRITTGILLGFPIVFSIHNLLIGNYFWGLMIFIWIFLLEISVAIILHRAKILEKFFKQYEEGIYKE